MAPIKPIIIKPQKKKKKKVRRILILVLLFLTFFAFTLYLFLSWRIKKEIGEIESYRLLNEQLRQELKSLQGDERYYEDLIRRRLGYLKEGEKILIYFEPQKENRGR